MAGKDYCVCVTDKVETVVKKPTGRDCLVVTNSLRTRTHSNVNCGVVKHVPFAGGLPQKKGLNPDHHIAINSVKGVSCINQLISVNLVTNVLNVALDLPVGARLTQFWEKWAALGVRPNVVTYLKEGYTLPFRSRPNLTRSPNVMSCYVNPHRNLYLLEALHQPLNKNAIDPVTNQTHLGFYNRLFLVPKPVETYTGPQQSQQISKNRVIQNGDSRDNKDLPASRGVGNFNRFQRRILAHTDSEPVKEVHAFSYTGQIIPV